MHRLIGIMAKFLGLVLFIALGSFSLEAQLYSLETTSSSSNSTGNTGVSLEASLDFSNPGELGLYIKNTTTATEFTQATLTGVFLLEPLAGTAYSFTDIELISNSAFENHTEVFSMPSSLSGDLGVPLNLDDYTGLTKESGSKEGLESGESELITFMYDVPLQLDILDFYPFLIDPQEDQQAMIVTRWQRIDYANTSAEDDASDKLASFLVYEDSVIVVPEPLSIALVSISALIILCIKRKIFRK